MNIRLHDINFEIKPNCFISDDDIPEINSSHVHSISASNLAHEIEKHSKELLW